VWRNIELRNFRSIESANLKLNPFTLVVGPNGSGKSNFADAFVFARDIAFDATSALQKRGGIQGVRRWSRTRPYDTSVSITAAATENALNADFVRHQFTIKSGSKGVWHFCKELVEVKRDHRTSFSIARDRQKITVHPPGRFPPLTEINSTTSVMLIARQLPEVRKNPALSRVRRLRLIPELMREPQVSSEVSRLEESGRNIAVALSLLSTKQKRRPIVEPMAKIIPGLHDIDVEPVGRFLTLRFHQRQGDQIALFSATEMSEGALRALGIIVAAHQMSSGELLIVEEPEVHIHPGAANLIFEILQEASQKGAVLLTTHSPELLDAARDEEILVCEYIDGVTYLGPLASDQRKLVRDGLFKISELMRSEPLRIEGRPPPTIDPDQLK
jgi:type I restriction enzyme M protein